jgi:hypothetical protein
MKINMRLSVRLKRNSQKVYLSKDQWDVKNNTNCTHA